MVTVGEVMTRTVVCIDLDTHIGDAMDLCSQNRIRHLPVLDERQGLAGLVTDRDLRYFISPRIGTISENSTDRQSLRRPVHLIMNREVVSAAPTAALPDAAKSMIDHRIGCLPVLDNDRHVVGIVTATDFLRYIAGL